MSRLLDDLLATAKKRSAAFEEREVDLAVLARSTTEEYAVLTADRSLLLDLRLPAGPVVWADPAALSRAMSNLLLNAVRLAPAGSTVTVGIGSSRGWSFVSVADEGPGIAEADRGQIFERFRRGTGDETGGSGLGLAIARQIAESHDGRLLLADEPGRGSTFVLWFPERAVEGGPERDIEPPDVRAPSRLFQDGT